MIRTATLLLLLAAPLAAQSSIDTLGGTTTPSTRAALAKANIFRVDKSVMLMNNEWYLDIPGSETLTFFLYRHHSQNGSYTLDWTKVVPVNGTGQAWYSPGPIPIPLIGGNHYALGVSWAGTLTYYYKSSSTGTPVSFGSWYSARTPTGLPLTLSITGVDSAQYYHRLTTFPLGSVASIGTPCTSATSPRLVLGALPSTGGRIKLDLVEAAASTPALYLLAPGPAMPTPLTVFGCSLWLNPLGGLFTFGVLLDASGAGNLTLPVPGDPWLSGLILSWQGIVIGPTTLLTNAVQFTLL